MVTIIRPPSLSCARCVASGGTRVAGVLWRPQHHHHAQWQAFISPPTLDSTVDTDILVPELILIHVDSYESRNFPFYSVYQIYQLL